MLSSLGWKKMTLSCLRKSRSVNLEHSLTWVRLQRNPSRQGSCYSSFLDLFSSPQTHRQYLHSWPPPLKNWDLLAVGCLWSLLWCKSASSRLRSESWNWETFTLFCHIFYWLFRLLKCLTCKKIVFFLQVASLSTGSAKFRGPSAAFAVEGRWQRKIIEGHESGGGSGSRFEEDEEGMEWNISAFCAEKPIDFRCTWVPWFWILQGHSRFHHCLQFYGTKRWIRRRGRWRGGEETAIHGSDGWYVEPFPVQQCRSTIQGEWKNPLQFRSFLINMYRIDQFEVFLEESTPSVSVLSKIFQPLFNLLPTI